LIILAIAATETFPQVTVSSMAETFTVHFTVNTAYEIDANSIALQIIFTELMDQMILGVILSWYVEVTITGTNTIP
jgi:hypothetical protein